MANVARGGFRPVDGWTRLLPHWYYIVDDYGTALASGDPVALAVDGTIGVCVSGNDSDAVSKVFGVICEIEYGTGSDRKQTSYMPASSSYAAGTGAVGATDAHRARVWRAAPGDLFEVTFLAADVASHDTTAELIGLIGNNADHDTTAPDSVHKDSRIRLVTTGSGTGTAQWRIVQTLPGEVGQSQLAASARFIVTPNESWWPGSTKTGT